jgi:hypothetical protein
MDLLLTNCFHEITCSHDKHILFVLEFIELCEESIHHLGRIQSAKKRRHWKEELYSQGI